MIRNPFKEVTLAGILLLLGLTVGVVLLLLPYLNQWSEKKRRVLCASNLRQIGTALMTYSRDHAGHLPTAARNTEGRTWDLALVQGGYLAVPTLHCPSDKVTRTVPGLPRSYAIAVGQDGAPEYFWIQGSRLPCPLLTPAHDIALVAEACFPTAIVGYPSYHYFRSPAANPATGNVRARHAGREVFKGNYLFLDGHVAWVDQLTSPMFPRQPGPPYSIAPCP